MRIKKIPKVTDRKLFTLRSLYDMHRQSFRVHLIRLTPIQTITENTAIGKVFKEGRAHGNFHLDLDVFLDKMHLVHKQQY